MKKPPTPDADQQARQFIRENERPIQDAHFIFQARHAKPAAVVLARNQRESLYLVAEASPAASQPVVRCGVAAAVGVEHLDPTWREAVLAAPHGTIVCFVATDGGVQMVHFRTAPPAGRAAEAGAFVK